MMESIRMSERPMQDKQLRAAIVKFRFRMGAADLDEPELRIAIKTLRSVLIERQALESAKKAKELVKA